MAAEVLASLHATESAVEEAQSSGLKTRPHRFLAGTHRPSSPRDEEGAVCEGGEAHHEGKQRQTVGGGGQVVTCGSVKVPGWSIGDVGSLHQLSGNQF